MIRVLVVDDHELFRRGIQLVLDGEPDITIVGEAGDGDAAVTLAETTQPDVVLMDLRMPIRSGIDATAAIAARSPAARVVILTVSDAANDLVAAVDAGAVGYLLKELAMDQLAETVRVVAAGGAVLAPSMTAKLLQHLRSQRPTAATRHRELTAREREVLGHLGAGRSNREIADLVGVAENTVKNHVRAVLEKLGARSRTEAVAHARRAGWA